MTWLKFLVVTPGVIIATFLKTFCSVYILFGAALLGDARSYQEISNDMLDNLGV